MMDIIIILVVYLKEKFLFSKWSIFRLFLITLLTVGGIFFLWNFFADESVDLLKLVKVSALLALFGDVRIR